jgi:protein-tyrosine phosphatase
VTRSNALESCDERCFFKLARSACAKTWLSEFLTFSYRYRNVVTQPDSARADLGSAGFVDCHTHMLPTGDDGVRTVEQGRALCREAYRRGTRILFATPHVWPHLTLTAEREAATRKAFAELRPDAAVELRLGFELTPDPPLLDDDPRRYELEGTGAVLMEVPFLGRADLLFALADHVEREGLRPVIAHPERTEAVLHNPELAREFADRGWLVQVNATSLTGHHGPEIHDLAWSLLHRQIASLVASDGHRETRPPFLDEAFARAEKRLGSDAVPLFDGSPLGLDSQ